MTYSGEPIHGDTLRQVARIADWLICHVPPIGDPSCIRQYEIWQCEFNPTPSQDQTAHMAVPDTHASGPGYFEGLVIDRRVRQGAAQIDPITTPDQIVERMGQTPPMPGPDDFIK